MSQVSEELIIAWLRLSAMMEKRTLVSGLSFNEAMVCNLIHRGCCTAGALCEQTKILKSQMNTILSSLEKRGIITRTPSPTDRRKVEIRFLDEGYALYRRSHEHTIALLDRLVEEVGEADMRAVIPVLQRAAATFDEFSTEVTP